MIRSEEKEDSAHIRGQSWGSCLFRAALGAAPFPRLSAATHLGQVEAGLFAHCPKPAGSSVCVWGHLWPPRGQDC